jgi:SagB-type dehydrogenase family enzyme
MARVLPGVLLRSELGGMLSATVDRHTVRLGRFSPAVASRIVDLKTGLSLDVADSLVADERSEIAELVRRLSQTGLLEYRLTRRDTDEDLAVIEPQVRDYAPRISPLRGGDQIALSRFAYMRRRGTHIVLESPCAGALFRLCSAETAEFAASLSTPQSCESLVGNPGFPGPELLSLLLDCDILFVVDAAGSQSLRIAEGSGALKLWEFHDLLFHARSTTGRHANPSGSVRAYADLVEQPPPVRPSWPGEAIDLGSLIDPSEPPSQFTELLRRRCSTRQFDDQRPITLAELSRFLDVAARIRSTNWSDKEDSEIEIAPRPYPSGGASYELELYLAVERCEGLPRGFYHYDAARHALTRIEAQPKQLEAMLLDGKNYMGARSIPQILVTIAARFGRVSWKYSCFAYSLVLKDVGVLMQTLYLVATDMQLGACAIGASDIDLFSKMTGLPFHVEGVVGQVALGRGFDDSR